MIHIIGQPNKSNDIMHQRKCTDLSLQPNPEKGYSDLCHPNPISLHIPIKIEGQAIHEIHQNSTSKQTIAH